MPVRYPLHSISSDLLLRFVSAVEKMVEDGILSRIGSIHGSFCEHGSINFLNWHRIYILEFEKQLQIVDRNLGNDGELGVPYLDWNISSSLPEIFRSRLSDRNLAGFTRDTTSIGNFEVSHLFNIPSYFDFNQAIEMDPHNLVHVAFGGSMASVPEAGYDPVFYCHHAGVDFYYQRWLNRIGVNNALEQLERELLRNDSDLDSRMRPFRNYTHRDCLDLEKLQYSYSGTRNMKNIIDFNRSEEIYYTNEENKNKIKIIIPNCKRSDPLFNSKSFHICVFIYKNKKQYLDDLNNYDYRKDYKNWRNHKHFCGEAGIFNGKGKECKNCIKIPIYNIEIDITKHFKRLKINKNKFFFKIFTKDEKKRIAEIQNTILYPPQIFRKIGNINENDILFGNKTESLKRIQKFLQKIDLYHGEIDGQYLNKTKSALKYYQKFHDLKQDGIIGDKTKLDFNKCRYDFFSDKSENKIMKSSRKIKYYFKDPPSYLKRNDIIKIILFVMNQWQKIISFNYEETKEKNEANLIFDFSYEMNFKKYDGIEKEICKLNKGNIYLNMYKKWTIEDEPKKYEYSLKAVLLHIVGHYFGFGHSNKKNCIMYPKYNCKKLSIENIDVKILKNDLKIID